MMDRPFDPTIHLSAANPWPGLSPFDENASPFFLGRDHVTDELLTCVRQAALTVLFGRSGLGKTSLLQAGLFPKLRSRNMLPVYVRLDVLSQSASLFDQVKAALTAQIAQYCIDTPAPGEETVWEYLHRNDVDMWSPENQPLTPVFVFDQFEEVFTLGSLDAAPIRQFRFDLADLIGNRIPDNLLERIDKDHEAQKFDLRSQHYRVLLSFREDFLPWVEGWKKDIPDLMHNRVRLMPMDETRAMQVVSGNSGKEQTHHLIDDETARHIIDFVAKAPAVPGQVPTTGIASVEARGAPGNLEIEPALLSLVCADLNKKRIEQHRETIGDDLLNEKGNSIISDFYDEATHDIPDKTRRFIQEKLITESGFRNSYPLKDALADGCVTKKVLEDLVRRRILRVENQFGVEKIEIIHDRLTDIVRERRDARRRADNTRKYIWRGAGLALAVVVLIGLGVKLYEGREAKKQELADALVMRSRSIFEGQTSAPTDVALLLSAAGFQRYQDDNTYSALQFALRQTHDLLKVVSFANPQLTVSPDFRKVVTVEGAILQLWDTRTGMKDSGALTDKDASEPITGVQFTNDGKALLSIDKTNMVRLWDITTRKRIFAKQIVGNATVTALSPDNEHLAVGNASGDVSLVSIRDNAPAQHLTRPNAGPVTSLAFTRQGDRLASGDVTGIVQLQGVANQDPDDTVQIASGSTVTSLAFSPDGGLLATGGNDGTVQFWKAKNGQPSNQSHADITSIAVSADDTKIIAGSTDQSVHIWDMRRTPPVLQVYLERSAITSVAVSADGRTMALGESNGTLRFIDSSTGKLQASVIAKASQADTAEPVAITSVALSSDGSILAAASQDGLVRLWNTRTREPSPLGEFPHPAPVTSIAISSAAAVLVSGSNDGKVWLWDIRTREARLRSSKATGSPIKSVAISPDGKVVLAGGYSKNIFIWNLDGDSTLQATTGASEADVSSVAFSPDGRSFFAGRLDGTVSEWDAGTGTMRLLEQVRATAQVRSIAVMPGGHAVLTGLSDGAVLRLDLEDANARPDAAASKTELLKAAERVSPVGTNGTCLNGPDLVPGKLADPSGQGPAGAVTSLAFSSDGKMLASAGRDTTIRLWDVATNQPIGSSLQGHSDVVTSVRFGNADTSVVSTSLDGTLRRWAVKREVPFVQKPASVTSIAYNSTTDMLAIGDSDGGIHLKNRKTNDVIALTDEILRKAVDSGTLITDPANSLAIISLSFSKDGSRLLSAGPNQPMILWDTTTHKVSHVVAPVMTVMADKPRIAVLSGDAKAVTSVSSSGVLRRFPTETGQPQLVPLQQASTDVTSIALSASGKFVVTGDGAGKVRVWDAQTGAPSGGPLALHENRISSIAISADDTKAVSADVNGVLCVFDLTNLPDKCLMRMEGPRITVTSLFVSPNGKTVIAVSQDDAARLWNVDSRSQRGLPLRDDKAAVRQVTMTADGKHIAYGTSTGESSEWDAPDQWFDSVCAKLTHNFDSKEWIRKVSNIDFSDKQCEASNQRDF